MANGKYTVNQSIWLAAALYAYIKYQNGETDAETDFCLKAATLQEMAQSFAKSDVQIARIHQHVNGDHNNCSNRFIRRIELSKGNPVFRVTAKGEFGGEKECPEGINYEEQIEYSGKQYSLIKIKEFMDIDYPVIIDTFYDNECTHWMIAGNPKQYDVIGAFSELGKVDWRQTFNAEVGDIVYIYVSDTIKEFRYKCRVNKTELETVQNDDRKFNVSGEFDGSYGRYMELEPIKELGGPAYAREELLKHGFKTLMGPMRVPEELQNYLDGLETEKYTPSLLEYDPKISSETFYGLLKDKEIVRKDILDTVYYLYMYGGEATCAQLATRYGNGHEHYNMNGHNTAKAIYEATKCDIQTNERGQKKYWPVLFFGRPTRKDEPGTWVWKLREPLKEAIERLISESFFDEFEKEVETQMNKKEEFDKNLILYGPPGTGKTYNSAIIAVKICDPSFDTSDYATVMQRYNELKAQNRIAFVTFHQSYGYEEFIEGIKPIVDADSAEIGYKIEPGCFKRFCEMARTPAGIEGDPNASIWFMRLDSDNAKSRKDYCFENGIVNEECKDSWTKERFAELMQVGDYIISYAGNSIYIDAIGVIQGEAVCDESKESYKWTRKVEWHTFIDRIDVKAINNNTYLPNFSIVRMNRMKLSDLLRLLPENYASEDDKPYVFIIDEINRGNISKIFGELITLIESTKREGMDEAASAILPYSSESFSVPSNVYILGTMNTADRSIALMDTALRRRFSFIEMMPDTEVLRSVGADFLESNGLTLDVASMLEVINSRIEFLFDREHTIGHAFFTGLAKEPTIEKLASIFEKSVIPLLQEYFYEDYRKIQLVLGDNAKKSDEFKFILDTKVNLKNLFMGNVEDVVDEQEVKYSINKDALYNIEAYISISGNL